jgi:hypothetical protein
MRRSFRTRISFSGGIPRVGTLGWYAMPLHGIRSEPWSTLRQDGIEPGSKIVRRDVRRRNRSQRPTATEDPNTKQRHGRRRRHCSRVRWPRFPHFAFGTHRSNAGSKTSSYKLPQRGNAYQPRASPWELHPREEVCSEGTPHRKGRDRYPRHAPMRRSFRTRISFSGGIPRVGTLSW